MGAWTSTAGRAGTVWRALPAIVLTAIVVACGGGGYGGSSSNYTPPGATSSPATVSVGSITGFGSVHLNGKKFETTSSAITVDGQPATQTDLHVGDVVEVKGHHDSATGKDIADQIELHSNVQGPVTAIDATGGQLVVLGQTVAVSTDTSFGDGIIPAALAGIAIGDILRVSGMTDAGGAIQATRIDRKPAGSGFRVTGSAASTDVNARTLRINALTVDFSAAMLVDFPSSGPADGDVVDASGTSLGSSGEFQATHLELRTGKELKGDAHAESEIEGLVTRFASTSDFDVSGRPVTAAAATTFQGGSAADLALNVRIEAEGVVDSTGVLAATKVRIERPADTRILAQADSVDTTAGTVTLLGVQVTVTAMTHFEDHSAASVSAFSVADIHSGDWLEVHGSESPAGSNEVVASWLERRNAPSAMLLAGVVKTATSPAMTILSVGVTTTPTTMFADASGATVAADAFFTGLAGKVAVVVGAWDGTTLTASKGLLGEGEGEGEDR